jgi:hypothetical protein
MTVRPDTIKECPDVLEDGERFADVLRCAPRLKAGRELHRYRSGNQMICVTEHGGGSCSIIHLREDRRPVP